ncbi:MAG: NAD-dependent epimerase/dehydratase family protein [Labilithrix sp.]|nr:NAD-dependent epimerase/dehydratase family protein [Labilithrix sp.]MCW5812868.1 NAD-dependent epimerase/dehydratase family protein [Labilithrix sp.]
MNRALVTGANGHIGSNLVRELLDHDYAVVAFVRDGADLRGLDGLDVRLVRGDVRDAGAVHEAMDGCTIVFHLAAPYVLWAKDDGAIVDPAVVGTENVLRAAKERGVKRVVLTGSCNAVGFTRGEPLDETAFGEAATSPYIRAKREQERRARALAEELDVDVVTVLPTAVLGPHDYRKTPTTAPFVDALRGKGPVPFPMNVVDVRDVARGHRLAAERGVAGERYLLGGDNVDMPTLATLIEKETGKKPAQGLPPMWVLRAVAVVAEAVSAVSGEPPMITRAILDDVAGGAPLFTIDKARKALGYEPRPAHEVVAATNAWAREMKWI